MKTIYFENEELYILQDLGKAYFLMKGCHDELYMSLDDRDLEGRILDCISSSKEPIFYDKEWQEHFEDMRKMLVFDKVNHIIDLVHETLNLDTTLTDTELETLTHNVIEHIENETEYFINEREL